MSRIAVALLTVALLTGCAADCEREAREAREARAALLECETGVATDAAIRAEQAHYLARWLAIAEGCELPLGVPCPSTPTSAEIRQDATGILGYTPTPHLWLQWGVVALRILAVVMPIGLAVSIAWWVWARLTAPARRDVREARALLDSAQAEAEQWRRRAEAARRAAREAEERAEAAEEAAAEAEARAEAARRDAERLAEARRVLSGL